MGVFSRKKSKQKKRQQAAEAAARASQQAGGSDSDISLMTDSDLEEERLALRAELNKPRLSAGNLPAASDPFEQASLWAEVDREELERIAVKIARNALPAAGAGEGAEAAARLSATAAAAEKADLHDLADPLGYGRIDTRTLALMRDGGPSGRYPPRYSAATAAGLLEAARARQSVLAGRGRGGVGVGEQAEAPAALRARVLPGGDSFDAELYLGTIHKDTSLDELQRGLLALRGQLSEHTGQLKSLVKENFDRFTWSKNTIDTVYAKLQRAEAEGEAGVHGASTGEVLEAVLQVQGEARHAFGPLLDRAAKADRIRLVLGVMRRYEAIVQLPSRVRQHAEAGDYEQVVADYRKAKALLGDASIPPPPAVTPVPHKGGTLGSASSVTVGGGTDSMWLKLMDEIDKVANSVAHSLDAAVRSAGSGPGEAADAAKQILQLKAAGVPAAQRMDPVGLYVESQERHVRAMLEGAAQQRSAAVEGLRRRQQASTESEAGQAGASPASSAAATPRRASGSSAAASLADSEALLAASEAAAVAYVSHVTTGLCQWLPEYWAVLQQRLPALAAIGDSSAAVEAGLASAERSVTVLLALYRSAVQSVLLESNKRSSNGGPGSILEAAAAAGGHLSSHAGLLAAAAELAGGCQALGAGGSPAGTAGTAGIAGTAGTAGIAAAPPAALACLQSLTEQAILGSLRQLTVYLQGSVAQLCEAEDFRQTASSIRAGAPATATLPALQQLLQQGMAHVGATLAEGRRAAAEPLRSSAAPARQPFFACFSAFAAGVEAAAAGLVAAAAGGNGGNNGGGGGGGGGGGQRQQQSSAGDAASAPLSSSRRLLVLCANLSAARSRLLPQQCGRWAAVLRAGGSGNKEAQEAAAAAAAELMAVETGLAAAYIDRKQAVLDEAMEQLLFADGTLWECAPPPTRPRPACLDLLHAVVAVQAELAAVVPSLLGEALEELLLGTLEGFAQVLSDGAPPASPGGVMQLHLEASLVLAAVGGLGGRSQLLAAMRLQAAADARLEAAVAGAVAAAAGAGMSANANDGIPAAVGAVAAQQLAAWAAGKVQQQQGQQGQQLQQRRELTAAACRARLQALCEAAQADCRASMAPLQQLAAGATKR